MKIKFLEDYIGRETAMKEYKKGDVLELDQQSAIELINFEIAEEVDLTETKDAGFVPKSSYKEKVKHVKNPQ